LGDLALGFLTLDDFIEFILDALTLGLLVIVLFGCDKESPSFSVVLHALTVFW
jgi:hypothetical protein